MTLNDFLNMWRKKDEYTYTNYAPTWKDKYDPIWKDKALEDCYRFFQMMSDEDTLVIDCQYEELCLVDLFGSVERNISEEDANFLIDKFGFTATKRAKEAMGKENKKEILNDDERKQLRQIVKNLIDDKIKVRWIKKVKNLYKPTEHKEHILIYYDAPGDSWFADWTDFEEGTRYKGMEEDKMYTPNELGL